MAPSYRIIGTSSRRIPVMMGWPKPPAPIRAPSVAVPTLMTAAVLIPAKIDRAAIGNSMRNSRARAGNPSASADSRKDVGMSRKPVAVLRTIGNKL